MSSTLNHSFAKAALSGEENREQRENIILVLIKEPAALLLTTYKQSGLCQEQTLLICDAWTTDLVTNQHVDSESLYSWIVDYLQTAAKDPSLKDPSLTAEAAPLPGPLTCCVQPEANTPPQHGFALTHFAAFILLEMLAGKNTHFC